MNLLIRYIAKKLLESLEIYLLWDEKIEFLNI